MNSLILLIKGIFIGIANIIPGVSGGTIALIMGIYEKFVNSISHFLKNFKENIKFLLPLLIGIALSMVLMSDVISFSFNKFPLATTLFFMGLVMGGVPFISHKVVDKKNTSNWLIFIISFSIVISMIIIGNLGINSGSVSFDNMNIIGYIKLFIIGMISSATMVIPGISGSLILMLIGYYYPVLELIKAFVHFKDLASNFIIILVLGLGVLMGIVLVSKIIEKLFSKYENKTNYAIYGFIVASIFAIPLATFLKISYSINLIELLIGILIMIIGYIISYKLGEK